jgi:hypothetical protein
MTMTATVIKPAALSPEDEAGERFSNDCENHQLHVLHDDGLYRHLLFRSPESAWHYRFELITWPGALTITGDMGTWTFARIEDMFHFFRSNPDRPKHTINPGYWGEKLQAGAAGGVAGAREYDERVYRKLVKDLTTDQAGDYTPMAAAAFLADVEENLLDQNNWDYPGTHVESAREALSNYHFEWTPPKDLPDVWVEGEFEPAEPEDKVDFSFTDAWEHDLTGYTYQFLWCLHALVWGIAKYDRAVATGLCICPRPYTRSDALTCSRCAKPLPDEAF